IQKVNFCRKFPRNHSLGCETIAEPCFILKREWRSLKNREVIVNAFLFCLEVIPVFCRRLLPNLGNRS
uniref:Uncharacterized protein n=1 Tax=Sciurus vulgaris TaxID=55149 RepID=A0A8D2E0Z6_SCIVU